MMFIKTSTGDLLAIRRIGLLGVRKAGPSDKGTYHIYAFLYPEQIFVEEGKSENLIAFRLKGEWTSSEEAEAELDAIQAIYNLTR